MPEQDEVETEISPVWAPSFAQWTFCAPIQTARSRAGATAITAASEVNGGMTKSREPGWVLMESASWV
jgi:hypothetical protein